MSVSPFFLSWASGLPCVCVVLGQQKIWVGFITVKAGSFSSFCPVWDLDLSNSKVALNPLLWFLGIITTGA